MKPSRNESVLRLVEPKKRPAEEDGTQAIADALVPLTWYRQGK